MESLLPSEIARLVLGYLEEQKCEEAARSFLETSPNLQECRAVTSTGRRFSTKVNSFTLVDILEKFCAANAIIHERLSKVSDCEQLKHCGDLLEQLRFLVDGSRGQRFVVNINVPTTSQASGGSPIISSSMRKRHHSGSDRDRSKRVQKSHSQNSGKSFEPVSSQLSCDAVETTPLENLPGHSSTEKLENPIEKSLEKSQNLPASSNCSSTIPEATITRLSTENSQISVDNIPTTLINNDIVKIPSTDNNTEKNNHETCSTGTDTVELMHYTNTEVQTTPYDAAESENESTYEPVENLSLLTKELLNRTELQERIAENINRAILPSDTSLRDISMSESLGGEMNTSIMTELNNAIKSVVTATESDPIFAKFLDEIIGPDGENDESPDDENDNQPLSADGISCNPPDSLSKQANPETSDLFEKISSQTTDIPLKNRLRSSSSQQTIRPDDDRVSTESTITKDSSAVLEDVNAAAILSIINANTKLDEEKSTTNEILPLEIEKTCIDLETDKEIPTSVTANPPKSVVTEKSIVTSVNTGNDGKPMKKTNQRKSRVPKPRVKSIDVVPENLMSEEDIMAMPTLIVCSKEEMSTIINSAPMITEPLTSGGYCSSQFLPIAPKGTEIIGLTQKTEPIYLRTVTVPTKISNVPIIANDTINTVDSNDGAKQWQEIQKIGQTTSVANTRASVDDDKIVKNDNIIVSLGTKEEMKNPEKITLYGNENSNIAFLDNTVVPTLTDETVNFSGTGLSPFLKFNNDKPQEALTVQKTAAAPSVPTINLDDDEPVASTSKNDDYNHIIKRTPRSLLKSRSKNNRLSMSTPRRRSSHIRALDFTTPSKSIIKNKRRMSTNDNYIEYSPKSTKLFGRKICRTSLFKSPPFTATATTQKKIKSPMKDRGPCKLPIATRSPAPKLMGGWEKYTGVGMILGSSSPSSSSGSPVKITANPPITKIGKSWDEDLRKSLQNCDETEQTRTTKVAKKTVPRKASTTKRLRKKIRSSNVLSDEASSDCESIVSKESQQQEKSKDLGDNCLTDKISRETMLPTIEEKLEIENLPEKTTESSSNISEISKNAEKEITKNMDISATSNDVVKTSKRKYATLKTITTRVTKNTSEILENTKIDDFSCTEKSGILAMPDMLELETPRKFDTNFGIPPTPRLLSPSSNLTTPYVQTIDETTRLRSFVTTPEFPPTPSINITPAKQTSNPETEKKEEYQTCSEYYEPSTELKDPRTKRANDTSRHDMSLPLPAMIMTIGTESRIKNISREVELGFQAITSSCSNKLEITQFEVIKENLPRDETIRELKISASSNELETNEKCAINVEGNIEISRVSSEDDDDDNPDTRDHNNTSSTIDDSSDSDSTSSSDTSSDTSSSSSSSNSSTTTNTSPNIAINDKQTARKIDEKICQDAATDLGEKIDEKIVTIIQQPTNQQSNISTVDGPNILTLRVTREDNETSPSKCFSICKTDDELKDLNTETPAKDESLLSEAVISDTPSSSKPGIETTNLTSKISAFITQENCEKINQDERKTMGEEKLGKKALPKVISIQRILPNVSIAIKAPIATDNLYSAMQNRNNAKAISDAKLSRQLEEKRLRLMSKIKENEKIATYRPRIKRNVVIARNRRKTVDKKITDCEVKDVVKIVVDTKENEKNIEQEEREKNNATEGIGGKLEEKVSTNDEKEIGVETTIFKNDDKEKLKKINDDKEKLKKINDDKETLIVTEKKNDEKKEKIVIKRNTIEMKKHDTLKNIEQEKEQRNETRRSIDEEMEKEKMTKKEIQKKLQKKKNKESTNNEICQQTKETKSSMNEIPKDEETTRKSNDDKKKQDKEKTDSVTTRKIEKSRRSHSSERSRTKNESEATKITRNEEKIVKDSFERKNDRVIEEILHRSRENMKKDHKDVKDSMIVVDTKNSTKSKVDLVKRDLFSDDESNDQRTTRSRTRQTTDFPENDNTDDDCLEKNNSSIFIDDDMPGVLECLDLVPTIKSDTNDEDENNDDKNTVLHDSSQRLNHAEYHFIYDESVSTKKRRRKFSNSELEFPVEVELFEDNYRKCPKLMKATIFEELFNLTPPRKRRVTTKDAKSTTVYKKKEYSTMERVKRIHKVIQDKPLASSSPVYKITSSKIAGKITRSPKKIDDHKPRNDGRKRGNLRNDTKQQRQHDNEQRNSRTRKRKASISKDEEQQVEKKPCPTNPQLLLNKLDLDKFLTTVHGPA